ncbi:MAG: transposase [Pseudomonadota bacterium]
MKSIGADLHGKSITFCTINSEGKIVDRKIIPTSEKLVIEYLKGIRGKKQLTFEEGPLAEWMLNITYNKVDRALICDPGENPSIYKGNSNDKTDSENLARLLRMGELKEVFHPISKERQEFRELVNLYNKIVKDITRSKNRLKRVFKNRAIPCSGQTIYSEKNSEKWLSKIKETQISIKSATLYWRQLEILENQKIEVYNEMRKRSEKFKEIKEFLKVKGVGLVTAATFSAFIFDPFRFKNKAHGKLILTFTSYMKMESTCPTLRHMKIDIKGLLN